MALANKKIIIVKGRDLPVAPSLTHTFYCSFRVRVHPLHFCWLFCVFQLTYPTLPVLPFLLRVLAPAPWKNVSNKKMSEQQWEGETSAFSFPNLIWSSLPLPSLIRYCCFTLAPSTPPLSSIIEGMCVLVDSFWFSALFVPAHGYNMVWWSPRFTTKSPTHDGGQKEEKSVFACQLKRKWRKREMGVLWVLTYHLRHRQKNIFLPSSKLCYITTLLSCCVHLYTLPTQKYKISIDSQPSISIGHAMTEYVLSCIVVSWNTYLDGAPFILFLFFLYCNHGD